MSKKIAHLGTVTLDTKLATSKQLNADEILANGEDVAEMFSREHTYREMMSRVKLQPEDNYILYTDDGTIVTANLSGVANGTRLFYNQTKLTEIPLSWKLDSITDGASMCASCTNLTSFLNPLNSLSNGSEMFANCNLNEKSVENILKTIPEYADGTHTLTLKMSADAFEKFNEITGNYLMAPGTISYKGWNIASNAIITIPVEAMTAAIEEIVGEGKVIVDTVPTENKVVVHTDRANDTQLEAVTALLEHMVPQAVKVVRYNHNMEISWQVLPCSFPVDRINKYDDCVNRADILAINEDYVNDVYETELSDKTFAYSFSNLTDYGNNFLHTSSARAAWLYMPKITIIKSFAEYASYDYFYIYAPKATRADFFLYSSNCPRVEGNLDGMIYATGIHTSSIKQWRIPLPSLSDGSILVNGCQVDKESVLIICNSIPAYTSGTHKLTLGIHVDHKYDVDVNLALKKVDINYEPTVELPEVVTEGKGWTLAVQWNGTPTAQTATTYGLRKAPIYAKVSEMELPDGTTEQFLDWGHYVTNLTDYKEFANLAEAREYYGLPSENIEEEELTNV